MKPIFSGNANYHKSAFINWRTAKHEDIHNMIVIAEGFLSSSIMLARMTLADNSDKKADILIFPILTNANHGIELYLKAIVWTLNKLLKNEFKIEGKHNIKQILETTKSRIKAYGGKTDLDSFNEQTKDLQNYINELFSKIESGTKKDNMDFSRYPFDEKYNNHFYINDLENIEIDLENFVLSFENIIKSLENLSSQYFYYDLKQ